MRPGGKTGRVGVGGSSGPGLLKLAVVVPALELVVAIGVAVSNALSGGIQKLVRPVECIHLESEDLSFATSICSSRYQCAYQQLSSQQRG